MIARMTFGSLISKPFTAPISFMFRNPCLDQRSEIPSSLATFDPVRPCTVPPPSMWRSTKSCIVAEPCSLYVLLMRVLSLKMLSGIMSPLF